VKGSFDYLIVAVVKMYILYNIKTREAVTGIYKDFQVMYKGFGPIDIFTISE
jgi:hypothetical protein